MQRGRANRDGSADLAALRWYASDDEPDPAWRSFEHRIAFIESKLRDGSAFSCARFAEVFAHLPPHAAPRRGRHLSNARMRMKSKWND